MLPRPTLRVVVWLLVATALVVSSASAQTPLLPPNNSAAQLISMSGSVSVMRDLQPWALNKGDWVQARQQIVTGPDGFATFQVAADGSTFQVFPNSRVVFRNNPGNWKDLLDLFLGHVKVHIQKLGGQPNRNRIQTPTALISVRGTIFDVVMEDESTTLVSVEEGQVEVRHQIVASDPKLVNAGEFLRVYRNQPLARSLTDRHPLFQRVLRAVLDSVLYTPRLPGGSVPRLPAPGGSPGGVPIPGDTGATPPPPPPGGPGATPPPAPPH